MIAAISTYCAILFATVLLTDSPFINFDEWLPTMPILPPHVLPILILVAGPAVMVPGYTPKFAWRQTVAVKLVVGCLLLHVMGGITPYGLLGLVGAVCVISATPIVAKGWRANMGRRAGVGVLVLIIIPIIYGLLPYGAVVVIAFYVMVLLLLSGRDTDRVVPMPPGFDWRNTPNTQHPGGLSCSCPRHTRMREEPHVIRLCKDCYNVYMNRHDFVDLSRGRRVLLWFCRNIVFDKFVEMRIGDVDKCYFCNSRGGGLRGKIIPPPIP